MAEAASSMPPFSDVLKQLAFESPDEISKKETGKKISEKIYSDQTGQTNNLNFFAARAVLWAEVEKWALGKQDMTQFLPYMNVIDGNKAYIQMDMTPIMVGPQFVGTLVESMAKNEEYPCVKAVDADSIDQKADRELEAIFRMRELETINDIQQQAGVQLEPTGAYVPDNELSAKVYFELEDRIPKEIRFEKLLEKVLLDNQYDRVLKRRLLHDNIVFNLEATKIEREAGNKYCIRKCIAKNMFYSFFMGDTGKTELGYIGEGYLLKAKDIRSKWGVSPSNTKGLTEKEIYDLIKTASTQNPLINFAHLWGQQYETFNNTTPWDEVSVYVIDFEIKVSTKDYYVSKTDSYGKENIAPKKSRPQPKSESARVIEKTKDKWYRGVYAPYAKMQVYWGLPDISLYDPLPTYTINIPNNNGEYIPSLFARAMEPLREYALTKLKRKQLIAKMRPTGMRIDVESARNVVTGDGRVMEWEEIVRIYDQTGTELWSSKGLNPLEPSQPAFSTTAHDQTLNNIVELSKLLLSIEAELRVLLGVPVYRDGADAGERTSGTLQNQQNKASFNVTDFILNAHNQVMEETLYKICLLSWQDIVKESKESADDLINTRFEVSVKMKLTAYERQLLEDNIQVALKTIDGNGNPLITFKDAFAIRNIGNYRLAELYLANKIEENKNRASKERRAAEQSNIESQRQTAQMVAQKEKELQDEKLRKEKELQEYISNNKKQEILLEKGLDIYKVLLTPQTETTGADGKKSVTKVPEVPRGLQSLLDATFQNIAVSLARDTHDQQVQIVQQAQSEQAAMEQQQMAEMQNQML